MHKFRLELLFHIIGIGSASGLFYKDNMLYLIGDNAGFLYQYDINTKTLEKHPVISGDTLENIPKISKPDFEALAADDENFYLFGSGSTAKRNVMITADRAGKSVRSTTDLTFLYDTMRSFSAISSDDFNIEGVVKSGDSWYFFQRGNGLAAENGVFTVTGDLAGMEYSILYNKIKLPKINGIEAGFTDAAIHDNMIYFLAANEDSRSTYHDGEVLGSHIGLLDPKTMEVRSIQKINAMHKFEGLTVFSESDTEISFLLCEDSDSDILKADIFKLTLKK